jgi:hypothetical protein
VAGFTIFKGCMIKYDDGPVRSALVAIPALAGPVTSRGLMATGTVCISARMYEDDIAPIRGVMAL